MSKKTVTIIVSTIIFTLTFAIMQPVGKAKALNSGLIDKMQDRASNSAARQENELTRIRTRADAMIQARLTSLQNLLTRVQNDKRLTDAEKSSFASDINTTISSLTALKTKIDADTDPTTALADTKSIVTSYRIYMIFEPKLRLTVIIDNIQTTVSNITTLTGKIQTLLDTLKSQGKDVTAAQNALNDANSQLNTINGILTTDKTLITNVQVGTSDPQSIFVQVRKDLATVRSDLAKVRADFASIRSTLQIILPKGEVTIKPTESTKSTQ